MLTGPLFAYRVSGRATRRSTRHEQGDRIGCPFRVRVRMLRALAVRSGPGDLPPYGGDDSAETSFLWGAGQVAHAASAMFRGTRTTGSTDGALWGPGVVNPTGAEIHLLLRDHGVATSETAEAMTHS